jgi:hypothetical protein
MAHIYLNQINSKAMKPTGIRKNTGKGLSSSTLVFALIAAEVVIYYTLKAFLHF